MESDISNKIKEDFIQRYIYLTLGIIALYIIIYTFFVINHTIMWYLIGGFVFLGYTYLIVRKRITPNLLIKRYLLLAPVFNFVIMLAFWEHSIASFVSLLPMPLAAYIFFGKKETQFFFGYMLVNIFLCFGLRELFNVRIAEHHHDSRNEVSILDAIIFIYNFLVIILLVVYNDKLKNIVPGKLENTNKNIIQKSKEIRKVPEDDEHLIIDEETAEHIITQLKILMNDEKPFRNPKLNISKLSVMLDISYNVLSKSIRHKGFTNFNTFINTYRISYVKQLLDEGELEKMTLMHIYTEAGFTSQTTFNRTFKQIEGVTPSEYIKKLNAEKNEIP